MEKLYWIPLTESMKQIVVFLNEVVKLRVTKKFGKILNKTSLNNIFLGVC